MPTPDVIAIAISDLHLSLRRPLCRADEDWMAVQAGYLAQVKTLSEKRHVPVICAGDIFDRWNPPPELVHFALKHLPNEMLCVPGQHDLPNHRIEDMHRSGYGVLKQAGKIRDLDQKFQGHLCEGHRFVAFGAGWNQTIPVPSSDWKMLKIAVVHRYCWKEDKCYPGAPMESNVGAYKKELQGYNIAVFGDNHIRFMAAAGNCTVVNCGGFIRRKSDEIWRKPAAGLIYEDGTVGWHQLDTSKDKFVDDVEVSKETPLDVRDFIKGLEELGEQALDFKAAVENHLRRDDVLPEVKQIILEALEHGEQPD